MGVFTGTLLVPFPAAGSGRSDWSAALMGGVVGWPRKAVEYRRRSCKRKIEPVLVGFLLQGRRVKMPKHRARPFSA